MTIAFRQFAASGVATTTNPATANFGSNILAGSTVICIVAMVDGTDPYNDPSDTAFGAYDEVDFYTSGVPRTVRIFVAENHPGGVTQVQWTKAASGSGGIAVFEVTGDDPAIASFNVVGQVDPGTSTDGVTSGTLSIPNGGVLIGLSWRDAAAGTFNHAVGTSFTDPNAGLIWNSTGRAEYRTVTGNAAATFTANDATLDCIVAAIAISEASTNVDLVLDDASHAHSVDNVSLTQANTLVVADALHAHTVDNLELTQANVVAIADALQAHLSDNVDLTQANTLSVDDAEHSHLADALELSNVVVLVVDDTVHAHLVDSVELEEDAILVVNDALHSHLVDNVSLSLPGTGLRGTVFVVAYQQRTFIIAPSSTKLMTVPHS